MPPLRNGSLADPLPDGGLTMMQVRTVTELRERADHRARAVESLSRLVPEVAKECSLIEAHLRSLFTRLGPTYEFLLDEAVDTENSRTDRESRKSDNGITLCTAEKDRIGVTNVGVNNLCTIGDNSSIGFAEITTSMSCSHSNNESNFSNNISTYDVSNNSVSACYSRGSSGGC